MIVVKVELHSAVTRRVTKLAEMVIFNKGDHPKRTRGNYGCLTKRKGSPLHPLESGVNRTGGVDNYPRLSKSVWCLVARALASMGYK